MRRVFNLGITLGEILGSDFVAREQMALTPWAGVALVLLALAPLWWLARRNSWSAPMKVLLEGGRHASSRSYRYASSIERSRRKTARHACRLARREPSGARLPGLSRCPGRAVEPRSFLLERWADAEALFQHEHTPQFLEGVAQHRLSSRC